MTTDNQIMDEKLQCDTNKEAAKILVLSSGKIKSISYWWRNITYGENV